MSTVHREDHKFASIQDKMTRIITITGAGGRIAYALIPLICEGGVFGQEVGIYCKLQVPR